MNKNISEATNEMIDIFSSAYANKKEDLGKALEALSNYGCYKIMQIMIIQKVFKVGLGRAIGMVELKRFID